MPRPEPPPRRGFTPSLSAATGMTPASKRSALSEQIRGPGVGGATTKSAVPAKPDFVHDEEAPDLCPEMGCSVQAHQVGNRLDTF